MALDIYVMPIWRFKVGDFESPIKLGLGIEPTIHTPEGTVQLPAKAGWFARWRARSQVKQIKKIVSKANGKVIDWSDDGRVRHSAQAHGLVALQAYAKWLDCRDFLPEFSIPEDGDYSKHPAFGHDVPKLTCPHLVEHDCYSGYFLPCDFERLTWVEPYKIMNKFTFRKAVGSTSRLLKELRIIQKELKIPDHCDNPGEDDIYLVRLGWITLWEAASTSKNYKLPIIFWG